MTQSTFHALVLNALQHVSPDRLQKAVCGLADGSLAVTLTRQTETELRALVKNGDQKEYGVTLAASLTSCSCKDSLYRGGVCKHAVAAALHVLRTPEPARIRMIWGPSKPVLCGTVNPARVWTWPNWPQTSWEEACPDCQAMRERPALRAAA
jgi:SWIM zinc finger